MADKRNEMFALLAEEKEILENRVIAEKDGRIYVNFHDAAILNSASKFAGDDDTGLRKHNPDGSIASSRARVVAINPDFFFLNRVKVKGSNGNKKLWVVCSLGDGFRCITEQARGTCFLKAIPVYVFGRETEDKDRKGELILEKVTTITDTEFITEYKDTLSNDLMAELMPKILSAGIDTTTISSMPI